MSKQNKAGRRSKKVRQPKVKAFGNLDTEQKYPITQDAIDNDRYVLLHYSHIKETNPNNPQKPIDTGIVDPRTYTFGIYTEDTYDEYVREDEKEGKVNTFNKLKDKYIVLHDPTLEYGDDDDHDDNEDATDLMSHTKKELLEMVASLDPQPTADELKGIDVSSKQVIVDLLNKYKTA